jgi:hypothetical protein
MTLFLVQNPAGEIARSIILQTRQAQEVDNVQYWELLPGKLAAAEEAAARCIAEANHPATRRREATGVYNCHGMTFANRRTGVYEGPDIERIIVDDGYKIIDRSKVMPGDVILYFEGTIISHSGIVIFMEQVGQSRVPFILSKWGNAGEYIHHYKVCPYKGDQESFYREAQD